MKEQVELNFFPLDIDYEDVGNHVVVRVFGITPDKKRVVILDKNFAPYFRAVIESDTNQEELVNKLKNIEIKDNEDVIKVQGVQIKDKILLKENVTGVKIHVSKPDHVSKIRDIVKTFPEISSTQEFDISFYRRYLIDKNITPCTLCRAKGNLVRRIDLDADIILEAENIGQANSDLISNLKIIGFDIETKSSGVFPVPEKDPIIMLSFYGNNFKKVITWKKFDGAPDYVMFVDGELQLIEEFLKTIKQIKPDVLVGYGSTYFDMPFLKERAHKYNISLTLGVDNLEPTSRAPIKIKGFYHIDLSRFVKNILDLRTSRRTLDLVSKELLGKGKLSSIKPNKIGEMWEIGLKQDLVNLVEYNLIDSQLAYELYEKLLPTQLQLVKLIGLPLHDINYMTYGQLVEWFLIRRSRRFNQIIPRRPTYNQILQRRQNTYTGAFVVEPKPGLYKNICVFDFRSLYPSIIASHNIDPAKVKCDCCEYKGGFATEESGAWFCSKEKGFIPSIIQDVLDRRKRITSILRKTDRKDPAYVKLKARRYALKTVANSLYGYMGYSGSRWYSIECAKAITEFGRRYIQDVIKEVKKYGFEVLYADTDSIFFLQENKTREEVMDFLKIINSVLPKPMELEYDGSYSAGLFIEKKGESRGAKKRYALLDNLGNILLKGVEAIRGDWSKLAKDAQKTVIEMLLVTGNVDAAAKYIQGLIALTKERKLPIENFIIGERLKKELNKYVSSSPHISAAKLAKEKGYTVRTGFSVNYVIGRGKGKISDRVILAEDAKLDSYDPTYYIEHQIIRAVYKIFEIFGYTREKLKAGQTTLSGFV